MLRIFSIAVTAWLLSASGLWAANYVVVVLDDSGSMNEAMARQNMTRMEAAKQALTKVLEILPDDTQVGIALLNGRVNGDPWVIPLGPIDMPQVRKLLEKVRAGGGTQLGRFLKVGADGLLNKRGEEHYGTYRLLVVTDGEANDPKLVERYLPDILSRGLTVDVIGVDMDQAHSLATKVHSYRQADDPSSLTQAIQEVFAETSAASDAGESDFELLEPFPTEVAAAALQALSDAGNERIGESMIDSGSDGDSRPPRGSSSLPSKEGAGLPGVVILIVIFIALGSTISRMIKRGRK